MVRGGKVRRSVAVEVWSGRAGQGKAVKARRGKVRRVVVGRGGSGDVWYGLAGRGVAVDVR